MAILEDSYYELLTENRNNCWLTSLFLLHLIFSCRNYFHRTFHVSHNPQQKIMADNKEDALSKRDFSRVILTLENVLIPEEKLSPSPSVQDGLDMDTETDLRILGCELIQTSGILLKLPQVRRPF